MHINTNLKLYTSRELMLSEMQSVSCRIWTRVAMSISYDDNHYTRGTSLYIYVIHRQICFVLSELFSGARHARFPKLGSKPGRLKRQSKILPLSHEETSASEGNLNDYVSQFLLFYIYPLNGYQELDSYEEPCIYANGNTFISLARELNPTGVGEYIYIYIYIHLD